MKSPTDLSPDEKNTFDLEGISVTIRNGKRTVEGYNFDGEWVTKTTYIGPMTSGDEPAFRSQEVTIAAKLSKDERKREAHRMRDEDRLTQEQIARRLGVSQQTISNDLRSRPVKDVQQNCKLLK